MEISGVIVDIRQFPFLVQEYGEGQGFRVGRPGGQPLVISVSVLVVDAAIEVDVVLGVAAGVHDVPVARKFPVGVGREPYPHVVGDLVNAKGLVIPGPDDLTVRIGVVEAVDVVHVDRPGLLHHLEAEGLQYPLDDIPQGGGLAVLVRPVLRPHGQRVQRRGRGEIRNDETHPLAVHGVIRKPAP